MRTLTSHNTSQAQDVTILQEQFWASRNAVKKQFKMINCSLPSLKETLVGSATSSPTGVEPIRASATNSAWEDLMHLLATQLLISPSQLLRMLFVLTKEPLVFANKETQFFSAKTTPELLTKVSNSIHYRRFRTTQSALPQPSEPPQVVAQSASAKKK